MAEAPTLLGIMFALFDLVRACITPIVFAAVFQTSVRFEICAQSVEQHQATVTINTTGRLSTFDPNKDLGAGIDGHDFGKTDQELSSANIKEMLSVGFKPITFRLRTELANDAWHWNPKGSWSEGVEKQGYWISDGRSDGDIQLSYGYSLPRRGNTIDQANNEGYSRIDDGDPDSFWKSNPYLDKYFTGDDNALHQQWLVIDLGAEKEVDSIRISWGSPFAVEYDVQYGHVRDISDISQNPPDLWHTFKNGRVKTRVGGDLSTRLSSIPVKTRYIRVLLKQSSLTRPDTASDVRDRLGFALREIFVGREDAAGHFTDYVNHAKEGVKQTNIYVSSTDPWHRSTDVDVNTEHVGFDRLFKSGLTNDSPALMPVGVLYGTPDNAAAEIKYLLDSGYKVRRVEMGEEPDGQLITPEDYGALYIQWAIAIHQVAPNIQLGGPSFQEIQPDRRGHKPELGNPVWIERFIRYLDRHHHSLDFSFFSFEWYPNENVCTPAAQQIERDANLLPAYVEVFRKHGLKPDIPIIISEYGYSAFAAEAEVDIDGALFNADTVGKFLTMGGSQAYLYGYEPSRVEREVACTAGNNMLFLSDNRGNITYRTSTYYGAELTMREWLQPSGGSHGIYQCRVGTGNKSGNLMISAYAVRRPDGQWSLMLINKDPRNVWSIHLRANNEGRDESAFIGEVDSYQFSAVQYKWDPILGHPVKSDPPEHAKIDAGQTNHFNLPPYSLTVFRGNLK